MSHASAEASANEPANHLANQLADKKSVTVLDGQKPRRASGKKSLRIAVAAALFAMLTALVWAESAGWPFLAAPLERRLTQTLQREVRLHAPAVTGTPPAVGPTDSAFSIRFFSGIKLRVAGLMVAAPSWSAAPHTLVASDVLLDLNYGDLWRTYRGGPLRVARLHVSSLDARLERLADGRATWQFQPRADTSPLNTPLALPTFTDLKIGSGTLRLDDTPLALNIQSTLVWTPPQLGANGSPDGLGALTVKAQGRYKNLPLLAELQTAGAVPELSEPPSGSDGKTGIQPPVKSPVEPSVKPRLPLSLRATVGRAKLSFDGSSASAFSAASVAGQYDVSGPSLAAVGDPVGVTLPSTGAFRSRGRVVKETLAQGSVWRVVVDDAVVGSSRLNGAFSYEALGAVPKLSGRLGGSRLLLADLGPAIGGAPRASDGNQAAAAPKLSKPQEPQKRPGAKVLPTRPFDLKALRVMDANVLIDINDVDLNSNLLQPLRPLRAHLQLNGGVLTLSDLDARTAQGELRGAVRLDGRNSTALWSADLRWNDVRLERWIKQVRANAAPPWVSGRLNGNAMLQGQGRSTAEILATLKGSLRTELKGGAVSHLAIEAAGLDLAQGLGILLKGDDALPVQCGVADLKVEAGRFKPRLMVIDTQDSAVLVDGSLSLADESMDLRAVVFPKDFSPLALRTPLLVKGSFSQPEVSVEKAPLARKLGLSVLLGLLNPLAALIPLIDLGDPQGAAAGGASAADHPISGCASFAKRARAASLSRAP